MDKTTLISFSVSNFGPFAEEVTISTLTDSSKKEPDILDNNTFEVNQECFNKVTYIYGANGTGKSSICKALLKLKNIIALSALLTSKNPEILHSKPIEELTAPRNYFKLDKSYSDLPTQFRIVILINDVTYDYSLSIGDEGLIHEERLTRKRKRTEVLFERKSPDLEDLILRSEFKSLTKNINSIRENVPILSISDLLNNELGQLLIHAILSIQVINMPAMRGLRYVRPDTFNEERIEKYLKIIKIASPTLDRISVSFEEKEEQKRIKVDDFENREFIINNIDVNVDAFHDVYENGKIIDSIKLPFLEIASNGTIKILNILPAIYNALETGSPLIIDEIDSGIHPNLLNMLINLFYDKESNPYNAQLICTSHSTEIIAHGNIRRDQIWFFQKQNNNPESELIRLSNLPAIRSTDNIAKKYLEGAFGGIPNI